MSVLRMWASRRTAGAKKPLFRAAYASLKARRETASNGAWA